jgi:hypothetical protein
MFQYAAARALARKLKTNLKLDLSFLEIGKNIDYTKRDFQLHVLDIDASIAIKKEIESFEKWESNCILRFSASVFPPLQKNRIIREAHFHFSEDFFEIRANSLLIGYFQSEKYFLSEEKTIRADFNFMPQMDEANSALARQIKSSNSVSLHVRRGDYVSNAQASQNHPLCSIDYYKSAVNGIQEKYKNVSFFVFSDDMEWTKENIKIDSPIIYSDHNRGDKSYNDMRLMSLCKHNIIANSSFSWWGAWLNINENKTVIAPKIWFSDISMDTSDLIPNNWLKI